MVEAMIDAEKRPMIAFPFFLSQSGFISMTFMILPMTSIIATGQASIEAKNFQLVFFTYTRRAALHSTMAAMLMDNTTMMIVALFDISIFFL